MEIKEQIVKSFFLDKDEINALMSLVGNMSKHDMVNTGVSEKDSYILDRLYSDIYDLLNKE